VSGFADELSPGSRWEARIGAVRVLYGEGRIAELGRLARELGGRRVLLVTDRGLVEAGHAAVAERALREADLAVRLLAEVSPNPTTLDVEAGLAFALADPDGPPDLLVAVGGGSVMDCAKGINFLLTNGGRIEEYWGFAKAARPLLPSLAAPSTAGTGSDAQSYALIAHPETGRKMACGDPGARFRAVVLDPALTASTPRRVAAQAGVDALTHAVESAVSTKSHPASVLLSRTAWQRLAGAFEASLAPRASGDSRGAMLLGAHLAGAAIEASMLGAAHAAANPLTARFRIPHGEAVGLVLPAVVRFNAPVAEAGYRELARGGAEEVAGRFEELRRVAGLPARIGERGVPRAALPALAELATQEWTGSFNPRPVSASDFLDLYESSY
jgi:alcohol dehydrogenase